MFTKRSLYVNMRLSGKGIISIKISTIHSTENDTAKAYWRSFKRGNMFAYEQLYRHCAPVLWERLKILTRDTDAAKDILQEIFIGLYEKKEKLPLELDVVSYLVQSAKFRFYKQIRSEKIAEKYQDYIAAQPGDSTLIPLFGETDDTIIPQLLRTIQALPERCREAFILFHFHQHSYRMIAEKMAISVKTVEKHLAYAQKKLKEMYPSFVARQK